MQALAVRNPVHGGRAVAGAAGGTAAALAVLTGIALARYGTVDLRAETKGDLVRAMVGNAVAIGTLASLGAYLAAPGPQKLAAAVGTALATTGTAASLFTRRVPGPALLAAPVVGAFVGAQFGR